MGCAVQREATQWFYNTEKTDPLDSNFTPLVLLQRHLVADNSIHLQLWEWEVGSVPLLHRHILQCACLGPRLLQHTSVVLHPCYLADIVAQGNKIIASTTACVQTYSVQGSVQRLCYIQKNVANIIGRMSNTCCYGNNFLASIVQGKNGLLTARQGRTISGWSLDSYSYSPAVYQSDSKTLQIQVGSYRRVWESDWLHMYQHPGYAAPSAASQCSQSMRPG